MNPSFRHHIALPLKIFAENPDFKNKVALSVMDQKCPSSLSFYEWDHFSDIFALTILKNITQHTPVIIQMSDPLIFAVTYFSCLKKNLLPLSIHPGLTPTEIESLKQKLKTEIIFNDTKISPSLFKAQHVIDALPQKDSSKIIEANELAKTNKEDPAFLLATSGTTGDVKIIVHSHRSIFSHEMRTKKWLNLGHGSKVLNTSALNWSYSLVGSLLDLSMIGAHQHFFKQTPTTNELLNTLKQNQIECLMSVPAFYRRLIRETELTNLVDLKTAVSAGEALSSSIKETFFNKTGLLIREGLGMSENSVYLVQTKNSENTYGELESLYPDFTKLSEENSEEILIHKNHPGLMLGYGVFEKNKISHETQEDWFSTGDLAEKTSQGFWRFKGRKDDLILAGGFKIAPSEIESVVLSISIVKEACAFEMKLNDKSFIALAIILEENQDQQQVLKKLNQSFEKNLISYKHPKEIYFCDEFPKTKSGKIKRQDLTKKLMSNK